MLNSNWDIQLQEELSPESLCKIIENECQPAIKATCKKIAHYFDEEPNRELPVAVSELVQLIFAKLQDELQHLFLKESGILFPGIKKHDPDFLVEPRLSENIHQTQKIIVNLLLKLRQLLNNYVIHPEWSKEWKTCVNEIFQLENKVHQWIYIEQSLLYPVITRKTDSL